MTRIVAKAALPLLVAAASVLAAAAAGAQSPWTLNRSGFYFQNTFSFLSSDQFFDEDGEKQSLGDNTDFRDITNSLYLEYGIRDRLGLVMSLPVKALRLDRPSVDPDLTNTGLGDFSGGLKFRVLSEPLVLSVQAEVKLPTGYNATSTTPPLGDGQSDFGGRLLVGRSLYPVPGFLQGGLGYHFRGRRSDEFQPADEILTHFDGGLWVHRQVLVVGRFERREHQGNGPFEDVMQGSLTGHVRLSPYVDVIGGFGHIFGGQNTTSGSQLMVGVAFKGNQLGKYDGTISSTLEETEPILDLERRFIPQGPPPPPPLSAPEGGETP